MTDFPSSKRHAASGSIVSYFAIPYHRDPSRSLFRATIRRAGREWKFASLVKDQLLQKVQAKLSDLSSESPSAAQLSPDQRRDALAAIRLLPPGETLESSVRLLSRLLPPDSSSPHESVADYHKATSLLAGRTSLSSAASFWLERNPPHTPASLQQAATAYLSSLRIRSPGYQRTVSTRLQSLLDSFGPSSSVLSLSPTAIEAFLAERASASPDSFANSTWNAWLTTFSGFFNFAVSQYRLPFNPLSGARKKPVPPRKVDFLPVDQVEKLFRTAESVAPSFTPALALLFFAGIRPSELTGQYNIDGSGISGGLFWDSIDIDGEIFLSATKDGNSRQIPLTPQLRAWLDTYGPPKQGRVVPNPQAYTRSRRLVSSSASVPWPQDFARHSFASHHFALHKNRPLLEAIMGHSFRSSVLEAHYKRPVRIADAQRYFSILPCAR